MFRVMIVWLKRCISIYVLAISEMVSFGQLLDDNLKACIGHYSFLFVSLKEGVVGYKNTNQFFSLFSEFKLLFFFL